MKGTKPFPSSFPGTEANMEFIAEKIEQIVNDLIKDEPDLFLVEIKIRPVNNVKVYIDGDKGISIDRLVQYNRRLYRRLDESMMFPNGDFSLEVSSPGLDEPLKLHRQYIKNIGRFVEVTDIEGSRKEGKLLEVKDSEIVIEEQKGQGKKKEVFQSSVPLGKIKTTKVQIKI